MKFEELQSLTDKWPLVESAGLRAFGEDAKTLAVQLDRWVKAGRLIRLRRGQYLLAKPYARRALAPEYLANVMARPSYVSLERALALHGLIPEDVPLVQSVTSGRTTRIRNAAGEFEYRHVKQGWFFGYEATTVGEDRALVAVPEKALLDVVYLARGELTHDRIEQMRLQDVGRLDMDKLLRYAEAAKRPRMVRAARRIRDAIATQQRAELVL